MIVISEFQRYDFIDESEEGWLWGGKNPLLKTKQFEK